jgi:peptidoglycan/xylan/chitin deacetylase (PgdA/CDA1 family)
MLKAISAAIAAFVRWSGLGLLVRHTIARRRVSMLVYHDPTPEDFERHLKYLSRRYNFVSLGEVIDVMTHDRWDELPNRSLVLTFDDGHRGNAALVDLFARYGVKPTIYICSQVVDTNRHFWFMDVDDPEKLMRLANGQVMAALEETGFSPAEEHEDRQALDASEIERMRAVVDFAAHTRFHPILPACSEAEAEFEIEASKAEVEQLTGEPCLDFSYPNGDYGEREVELVRKAGYRSARTVDLGWNTASTDPFRLKGLGTSDTASTTRLASDLSGVSGWVARLKVGSLTGRHRAAVRAGKTHGKAATLQMITYLSLLLYEGEALLPFS